VPSAFFCSKGRGRKINPVGDVSVKLLKNRCHVSESSQAEKVPRHLVQGFHCDISERGETAEIKRLPKHNEQG